MSRYPWVFADEARAEKLFDVGILDDGSLHNPRGYDSDLVRSAVMATDERWRQRRSDSAKKAAVTRAKRREKDVHTIVRRIVDGWNFGPSPVCKLCRKRVTDEQSIERGIGPECWQDVLSAVEAETATRTAQ